MHKSNIGYCANVSGKLMLVRAIVASIFSGMLCCTWRSATSVDAPNYNNSWHRCGEFIQLDYRVRYALKMLVQSNILYIFNRG